MHSKYNEIQSLIEDLTENTIIEFFGESFSNKKECCVALDVLIDQLSNIECDVFAKYFDN